MKTRQRHGLYAPELLEARIAPATFTVTSLLDNGADGTLRKEIADANAQIGADTIVFILPAPIDDLINTIVLNGTEIPITDPLTIKGPGIDRLAVSGDDLSRIFNINYAAASLKPTSISGLTLTHGKSAASGGAIYSDEPLALKDVVIRSSYTGDDGGAVFVNTTGKVSIANSRIVHNEAASAAGGLYLRGQAGVSVVKTIIANNRALFFGGLHASVNADRAVIVVDGSTISNNNATGGSGGGLHFVGGADDTFLLKNSVITGNSATDGGGGLYFGEGNLVVTKTTFSSNTAKRGGAIIGELGASLTVSGSRFIGNTADDAAGDGGGALFLNGTTVLKIAGTLFAHNDSANVGGAISHDGAVTMTIAGSSFLGNDASAGGAVQVGDAAVLTMKGSILSGNTAGFGGAIAAGGASVVNLIGNKFTENKAVYGGALLVTGAAANAATANLSGNLFQANVAIGNGGGVLADDDSVLTSKADKFIANVATGQGGGVYLINAGGIVLTGTLFQRNVSGSSGGGAVIGGDATLTGLKVLDNIAGSGARGGGLRISAGTVEIKTSIVTGNVAEQGGGIFFNVGTTTLDVATVAKTKGNTATSGPNIGSI